MPRHQRDPRHKCCRKALKTMDLPISGRLIIPSRNKMDAIKYPLSTKKTLTPIAPPGISAPRA
jgi:hypothetical protein